jgi:hypothetical protein
MTTLDLERARLRAIAAADDAVARLSELADSGELPSELPFRPDGFTYQPPAQALDQTALDRWISSVPVHAAPSQAWQPGQRQ